MKKSIESIDVSNKKVIIRCDLNVPIKDGVIQDDTRIRASLKTINYILDNNGSVIILSHLGKVKEESDKIKNSLKPVSVRLSELLNREVLFSSVTCGEELDNMASDLKSGEVLKEYIEPTKVIEKVKTIEEPKQVEKIIEKQEAKQIIQAKSIQISNNIKASIYEAAKACLEDKNITMFEKVLELLK